MLTGIVDELKVTDGFDKGKGHGAPPE